MQWTTLAPTISVLRGTMHYISRPGVSAKGVPTNDLNKKVVERVVVQSGGYPGA